MTTHDTDVQMLMDVSQLGEVQFSSCGTKCGLVVAADAKSYGSESYFMFAFANSKTNCKQFAHYFDDKQSLPLANHIS